MPPFTHPNADLAVAPSATRDACVLSVPQNQVGRDSAWHPPIIATRSAICAG